MASAATAVKLDVSVSDLTTQRTAVVPDVPSDSTVNEFINELVRRMKLPRRDAEGQPLIFHALLEREGRHLHGGERVTEVMQPGDRITLLPQIEAGSGPPA